MVSQSARWCSLTNKWKRVVAGVVTPWWRKRNWEQWFLRITDYADRLVEDLEKMQQWPEQVKMMQRNWIGRSEGAEVVFSIPGMEERISVFTTRPDTLFGVTYQVLAPEHPLVEQLIRENRGKRRSAPSSGR